VCRLPHHPSSRRTDETPATGCWCAANVLYHDSSIPMDQKWALPVDMQNAFNLVDREAIFAEVRTHFPKAAAWVEFSYRCHPFLKFGNGIILFCLGIHQGDPLGPLFFALTLHPLLKSIKDQVVGLRLNAWFLDDSLIVGTGEAIMKVFQIIIDEGPFRGFHLWQDKSSFWCGPYSALNKNPWAVMALVPRKRAMSFLGHLLVPQPSHLPSSTREWKPFGTSSSTDSPAFKMLRLSTLS
jgi:hypothetical protein